MPSTPAAPRHLSRIHRLLEKMYGPRPWQCWGKPLDLLVETILSQNTSDQNSSAAYRQLRRRFKSWKQVATAPEAEVERHIRTAGLSKLKAPRIQSALRRIKQDTGRYDLEPLRSWDPEHAYDYLRTFPGVGPKTACCTLLFSFNFPLFPVDTHVHRIATRLALVPAGISADKTCELLTPLIPPTARYSMHVLLIDHGRQTCRAQNPKCEICLLLKLCPHGQHVMQQEPEP